jgi:ubiquinone/menaquinone biosynthesis C-methylase UbiE
MEMGYITLDEEEMKKSFTYKAVLLNTEAINKVVKTKVLPIADRNGKILDVGGGDQPLSLATHVIDIQPFRPDDAYKQGLIGDIKRFNKDTWLVHDACNYPWPYKDNEFDFIWCVQMLEDIRDPIGVCKEMMRVGKSGYINCPSKFIELLSPISESPNSILYNGFWHHRWLVNIVNNVLTFEQKHVFATVMNFTNDTTKKIIQAYPELGKVELHWTDKFDVQEIIRTDQTQAIQDLYLYLDKIKERLN